MGADSRSKALKSVARYDASLQSIIDLQQIIQILKQNTLYLVLMLHLLIYCFLLSGIKLFIPDFWNT